MKRALGWFTVFVLAVFAHAGAAQQSPKLIASFHDWDTFSYGAGGAKICYAVSAPLDMEPKNVRRGDVYFTLTYRPAGKVKDEVGIVTGYTYKKDSAVKIALGGRSFDLFTQDDGAWVRQPADETSLVQAMVRGSDMVVRGTSSRGTLTTDRYSLLGFTAARKAIASACGG